MIVLNVKIGMAQKRAIEHDKAYLASIKIFDKDTVDIILDELMIDSKKVEYIEIIDLNDDGFGINDFLKIWPSGVGQHLSDLDVSEPLRKILKKLPAPLDLEIVVPNSDIAKEMHEEEKSTESSILVTFVEMLSQSYKGSDIKLMLKKSEKGYSFEISGFNPDLAEYHSPLIHGMEKIVENMGPEQVMRTFFENLKKKFVYEPIIIREVIRDTLFAPTDKNKGN